MKLPKIKAGLVVTLAICASIIIFRTQVVAGMVMLSMMLSGHASQCPFRSAIGSYALAKYQVERASELHGEVRLVGRDPAGYEQYELGGRRIWVPAGSLTWVIYDLTEQERGIYNYRELGATKGEIVLDAGANIGLYTIEALKHGARKVIAIEPVPANVECLRRNLEQEIAEGKVVIYPKGIWDRDDVLEMNVDPANQTGDSFVLKSEQGSVKLKLPLTTVDTMVAELHLEKVDFIKMDIEGAERRALQGAAETIRRFHPRMAICVYHQKDDPVVIPAAVRSLWHEYRQECGPCLCDGNGIAPQVYFYF